MMIQRKLYYSASALVLSLHICSPTHAMMKTGDDTASKAVARTAPTPAASEAIEAVRQQRQALAALQAERDKKEIAANPALRPFIEAVRQMKRDLEILQNAAKDARAAVKTSATTAADRAAVAIQGISFEEDDFDDSEKFKLLNKQAQTAADLALEAASPGFRESVKHAREALGKVHEFKTKMMEAERALRGERQKNGPAAAAKPPAKAGASAAAASKQKEDGNEAAAAAAAMKTAAAPAYVKPVASATPPQIPLSATPAASAASLPPSNAAAPKAVAVNFRAVDVALDKVGATSNTVTNGASGALTITTDNNAFASYQMTTPRFAVQGGQTVRITYDILVQQGGKISLGLLNTTKKGWYGGELVMEAGTHKGTYDRVVPAGEAETSLVFRNYHLGKAGQSTFTINKYSVEIQPAPVGAAVKK